MTRPLRSYLCISTIMQLDSTATRLRQNPVSRLTLLKPKKPLSQMRLEVVLKEKFGGRQCALRPITFIHRALLTAFKSAI